MSDNTTLHRRAGTMVADGFALSLAPVEAGWSSTSLQRAYKEGRKDRDEDDERRCGGWSNVGALRFADARRDA